MFEADSQFNESGNCYDERCPRSDTDVLHTNTSTDYLS